jgi:hypothetical protein
VWVGEVAEMPKEAKYGDYLVGKLNVLPKETKLTSMFGISYAVPAEMKENKMIGINKEALEGVLARVYSRHLIPAELRLAIWKLLDLGECAGCGPGFLYSNAKMLEYNMFESCYCNRCIPSHFLITINKAYARPFDQFFPALSEYLFFPNQIMLPPQTYSRIFCHVCDNNPRHTPSGFSPAQVKKVREVLEDMKRNSHVHLLTSPLTSLSYMEIEYFKGVFKRAKGIITLIL